MNAKALQNIIIVGGGTAGWMTATALTHMFGEISNITLIESDDIGIIGVGEATIPSIQLFNNLLGINENEFLSATQGTIKLGIEFTDWLKPGHSYMHAFGAIGREIGLVPFHNYWVKDYIDGAPQESLWDYSINYQSAKLNKFARPDIVRCAPLEGMPWAFHFDASLYAQYLRKIAQLRGAKRIEGKINKVNLSAENGNIESVSLENGSEIKGDLFIDCSGFRSLLLGDALGIKFKDYSDMLPVNRAWAVPCENVEPLTPYTRSTAREAGWQWRIPLQHRIGNGHVFSSDYMSEDEACSILLNNLDGKRLDEPRLIKFKTGRREVAFHKNCVAIGLSLGFLEPLESTAIHFIQSGIARLISLMPSGEINQNLVDEYNKQGGEEFDLVRDFIVLHYHAQQRTGQKFWDDCRERPISDSLKNKIDLFSQTGVLSQDANDLFKYSSWIQVLIGQGIIPKITHPYVQTITNENRSSYLNNISSLVKNAVSPLPDHRDFIKMNCSAAK